MLLSRSLTTSKSWSMSAQTTSANRSNEPDVSDHVDHLVDGADRVRDRADVTVNSDPDHRHHRQAELEGVGDCDDLKQARLREPLHPLPDCWRREPDLRSQVGVGRAPIDLELPDDGPVDRVDARPAGSLALLGDRVATVDDDRLTGDVGGTGRGEPQHGARDLVGSWPTDRIGVRSPCSCFVRGLRSGSDPARAHGVDRDARAGHLDRDGARQSHHARLGSAVVGVRRTIAITGPVIDAR